MFTLSRPDPDAIENYLRQSRDLPLSYSPIGITIDSPGNFKIDESHGSLGFGVAAFERAKAALSEWRHFDLGWVELFPPDARIEPGTVVAVVARHLGFWSLNGCRVLQVNGHRESGPAFGFAYGTLTNHAEMGEELFQVEINSESQEVTYRIRAASKPRAQLARIGYPITRSLQARFRRDSILAMRRAMSLDQLAH
jgi:uncharacterized protein (UPF0548 family)